MSDRGLIHVIDDDDAVRESIDFLLAAADFIVRTYASAAEFLKTGSGTGPACILTDVRMPDMSGLELLQKLKADGVVTPVIVMTGHGDIPLAVEAMKAGAFDFIEKPFDDQRLIAATEAALRVGTELENRHREQDEIRALFDTLTPRERDVMEGLVQGKPNKIIAYDLGISPRTVEVYRANVMQKLKAGSLSDVVKMALSLDRKAG